MNDLLIRAARGERTERPPVWLMRQAGRHLPEYRELRSEYSFLEAVKSPEIATEITLQPWERYQPDGLVIFSDILTILEPFGFTYRLEPGSGPIIDSPINEPTDVPTRYRDIQRELHYVGDLLEQLEAILDGQVPLIGFAGGPFTLASYVITGNSTASDFAARRFRVEHPTEFRSLLSLFAEAVREFLEYQIDNGADMVQLFDTYASTLSPQDYREFILPLHQAIFRDLEVPSVVFVRNMAGHLDLLQESGADVIALDWSVNIESARTALGSIPVQGNLDPSYLFGSPAFIQDQTLEIIEQAGDAGHILNLGHGVHKETPIEGVRTFIETAKSVNRY